jgi:hypothetical protein
MFRDISGAVTWENATGVWWVKGRDVPKHLTMHRAAPLNKELLTSVTSTELEKLWFRVALSLGTSKQKNPGP